ncbi:MAG: CBS domain-containing protein [Anaerolineales bacterium]
MSAEADRSAQSAEKLENASRPTGSDWPTPGNDVTMLTVQQILDTKGNDIWSTKPSAPVYWALEVMAEYDIGALLVMEGEKLVGIMSERDYARKVRLQGKSSLETPVNDIMTRRVRVVSPKANLLTALRLMSEKGIRHLPVVQGDTVIGVVSQGDVVKKIMEQQDFTISQLENYISGTR